jgi:hypothetical protein
MGTLGHVKTTIEISDALLSRAKVHARRSGKPLRAVVEEGLRRVLADDRPRARYELPDCSVGKVGDANPLDQLSWPELRAEIYGDR